MTGLRTLTRDRAQVLRIGQGYFAETYQRPSNQSGSLAATQLLYGMAVGLLAGDVVTNMTVPVQTAGASVTLAKVALYSKTGTLLASSADASASFNSTGLKTVAMSSAYTVPTDDLYYAAFLAVSTVTMPTILRGMGSVTAACAGGIGSGSPVQVVQTGQADLPSPATFVVGSGNTVWIGLS